jgi:hypothetical protein
MLRLECRVLQAISHLTLRSLRHCVALGLSSLIKTCRGGKGCSYDMSLCCVMIACISQLGHGIVISELYSLRFAEGGRRARLHASLL